MDLQYDNWLDCPVCMDEMLHKTPRALPCLHTFCENCISQLLKRNSGSQVLVCPVCKQLTRIPRGRVEDLPKNFYLQSYLTTKHNSCALCLPKNSVASKKCVICSLILCQSCGEQHIKHSHFSDHKVVNLPTEACKIHGKPIELICKSCRCDLCIICAHMDIHQKHQDQIEDHSQAQNAVIGKTRKLISAAVLKSESYISKLKDASDRLDFVYDDVSEATIKFQRKISQNANRIKSQIDAYKSELSQKIENTKTTVAELEKLGQDILRSKYQEKFVMDMAKDKQTVENQIEALTKMCSGPVLTYGLRELGSNDSFKLDLYETESFRKVPNARKSLISRKNHLPAETDNEPATTEVITNLRKLIYNLKYFCHKHKSYRDTNDPATEKLCEITLWYNKREKVIQFFFYTYIYLVLKYL